MPQWRDHPREARLEQWGSCWSSYYELEVEYFMIGGARNVLSTLTQNFLWVRTFVSTPMCETEGRDRYPDRVDKAAERIQKFQPASSGGSGAGDMPSVLMGSSRSGRGGGGGASARKFGGGGGPGTGEKRGKLEASVVYFC